MTTHISHHKTTRVCTYVYHSMLSFIVIATMNIVYRLVQNYKALQNL